MAYRGPDEKPESVTAIESLNGSAVKIEARNTSNTSSSDATLKAQVAGTSAGDAKVDLTVNGTTTWTVGVDNSDSDALKIGPDAAVGTSTAITVTTAGVTTVGSLAATNAALTTPTVASATLTGVLDIPRGSVSAPSISFTGDANTGIYSSAADNIQLVAAGAIGVKADADGGKLLDGSGNEMISNSGGTTVIASNGTQRFTASSSGVTVTTVGIITPVGSASAPSHTFTGDTNTGIYSSTADNVDVTTGGTQRVNISSAGVDIKTVGVITPLGSDSTPSHTFTGDLNTGMFSSGADTIDFATGGTNRVSINSSGEVLIGVSSTANGGKLQISNGITFPATQSACTDANTLDDYEEGTWTPVVIGLSTAGIGTYNSQVGTYTKIGRMVTAYGRCDWTAHTGTGNLAMSLPFTSRALTNLYLPCAVNVYNITLTASNAAFGQLRSAESNVRLMQQPVGGGADSAVAMDTSGNWAFQITYEV